MRRWMACFVTVSLLYVAPTTLEANSCDEMLADDLARAEAGLRYCLSTVGTGTGDTAAIGVCYASYGAAVATAYLGSSVICRTFDRSGR